MSSSNDMSQMYKSVKPTYPDCAGKQFSADAATPEYLGVSYGQANNEIAEDRPFHEVGLAGDKGRFGGRQFASGFSSYGQAVEGQSSVERITVDTSRADRGKES